MDEVMFLTISHQETDFKDAVRGAVHGIASSTFSRLPHPIPYQGSKRNLASMILAVIHGRRFRRFYEPFAGSAAMTIAASHAKVADTFILGDSLAPLMSIWNQILTTPHALANAYEKIWESQLDDDEGYYYRIRDEFNRTHDPARLLYLLARCVKNAPRFNQQGQFNQSVDKRRLGMRPDKMRHEILAASTLLAKHATAIWADFETTLNDATIADLVYLDPPYEGTTTGDNKRYHQGLERARLITALESLNRRGVPFLLSYDGQCGDKVYGSELPASLHLTRLELNAGRSSQATLNGREEVTIESLYVSSNLVGIEALAQ
ncbi:MAG: DNA adenine methylase [Ktedonobacteraceae bacterium]